MSGRAIPAAVNWAALLKQTAPADRKLMAAFKLKVWIIQNLTENSKINYFFNSREKKNIFKV